MFTFLWKILFNDKIVFYPTFITSLRSLIFYSMLFSIFQV